MGKLYGVGILDADYQVTRNKVIDGKRKRVWTCPYYLRWANMLKRCYNKSYQDKQPTYVVCSVCEDWLYFSKFRDWMEKQEWEGKQLDKDLLSDSNIYSPSNCVFVTSELNKLFGDCRKARGEFPLGVYWDKERSLFAAQMTDNSKHIFLGRYTCHKQAHKAWQVAKLKKVRDVVECCSDVRVVHALSNRILTLQFDIANDKITEGL